MPTAALIYPHQLFETHPALAGSDSVVLVEDPLFFRQYPFHRQKLLFHRATMKRYADGLSGTVQYLDAHQLDSTGDIVRHLKRWKIDAVRLVDPNDDWLLRRLTAACTKARIAMTILDDPDFLTPSAVLDSYAANRKKLFFTDFYIEQRKRLGILLDDGKPAGGKWSFDTENRKKLPAGVRPPAPRFPAEDEFVAEAREYVHKAFPEAPAEDAFFGYPTSRDAARSWLGDFLKHRLADFGQYEDAISTRETIVFHSVLTPMLNVGLLTPREVVDATLAYEGRVPMNSLEGFLRQVIGWREFVRLVYRKHGRAQRTRNFWEFTHPIPASFYDGTTGIDPVDRVIRNVLRTGYCHHIERLMILGNFMLLCEIDPDDVCRWFMELFIDAYDWVMVPNIYGMSQHADGGLMTTKPYISGSAYVLKMSDEKKGAWCPVWDALYWRFIDRHADFFRKNPRMAVMVKMKEKLGPKMAEHHKTADEFLQKLHSKTTSHVKRA
jgi:deoxyribodipyrimidine photolyase-related protein